MTVGFQVKFTELESKLNTLLWEIIEAITLKCSDASYEAAQSGTKISIKMGGVKQTCS